MATPKWMSAKPVEQTKQPAWMSAKPVEEQAAQDPPQKPARAQPSPGIIERVAYSTPVQAITDIPYAAAQVVLSGPDKIAGIPTSGLDLIFPGARAKLRELVQRQINERAMRYKALPENQNVMADINEGIITAVASAKLPGMANPQTSIAAQGATGAMMTPVTGKSEDVATGKLVQGGVGGTVGAVFGGAGKVIEKVRGELPLAMQALQETADKWGVKLRAGDLSKGVASVEDIASRMPLSGTDDFLTAQQSEAKRAAETFVSKLRAKVGSGQGTASEMAMGAGRDNHAADKAIGREIYEAEARLAGTKEAPRNNIIAAMNEERALNARQSSPDKGLESDFANRIRRLTQTSDRAKKAGETPMDRSYKGLESLRSEFWKEAKKYQPGSPEYARYMKLADAAEKDMDAFVENAGIPELKGVHDVARNWWRTKVKNYSPDSKEYAAWAKQIRGKDLDAEKVMDFFVQAGQDGKAKYFYNGLDGKGRAAVRWGMANDALKKATDETTGHFSPGTFATEFKRLQDASDVFFTGKEKWELDGFVKLMRAVDRSGSANSTIKTGWGSIGAAVGTGEMAGAGSALAMGHPLTAAAMLTPSGAARAFKMLTTSEAGKRLLLASSSLSPGSKGMNIILERELPKVLGVSSGATATPKGASPTLPSNPVPAFAQNNEDIPFPPIAALQP